MQVAVSFRHLEASDALRDYARGRILRLARLLGDGAEARIVLSVERLRHRVEVALAARSVAAESADEAEDIYTAVDRVVDRLRRQVGRVGQDRRGPQRQEPARRSLRGAE